MQKKAGLLSNHFQDAWMGVPERIHADTANQIKVPLSFQIEHIAALPAMKDQWVASVIL